jgi:hypothetical protein
MRWVDEHAQVLVDLLTEADGSIVAVPPAFLIRAARMLDTAASHPDATTELAAALHRDAMRLRAATR